MDVKSSARLMKNHADYFRHVQAGDDVLTAQSGAVIVVNADIHTGTVCTCSEARDLASDVADATGNNKDCA